MKLSFLVIAILINFFNHSLIKSEEKIDSKNNTMENISKEESKTKSFYIMFGSNTINFSFKKQLLSF